MRILVTRPQPDATRTAARLTALGHEVVLVPLLTTAPLDWQVPAGRPDAVAFTSAAAVRLAGPQLDNLRHLPVFAVGSATAAAARETGFDQLVTKVPQLEGRSPDAAVGTAAALFEQITASGFSDVLYLAARDRSLRALPAGVELREVYAAALTAELTRPVLSELANGTIDLTLLYSARTAAHFGTLVDAGGLDRSALHIAAFSLPAVAAAGPGWKSAVASLVPTETALFAAAGLLG